MKGLYRAAQLRQVGLNVVREAWTPSLNGWIQEFELASILELGCDQWVVIDEWL